MKISRIEMKNLRLISYRNLKLMKKRMKTKEKKLYDFKKENETFRGYP